MPSAIIDPIAIANLRALAAEGDDSFLHEIVTIFLEDTPARIADLKHAFAAQDLVRLCRAAHSIKGSASNLGAEQLRAHAEWIENSCKDPTVPLAPQIDILEQAFAAARQELEHIVGTPPAT